MQVLGIVVSPTTKELPVTMSGTETLTAMQDQYIDFVKQAQSVALDAVRTIGSVTGPYVADLPSLPFTDKLPSPQEALKANFDFVEKAVAVQRVFATQLVAALSGSES